jgi:hypothetical protein
MCGWLNGMVRSSEESMRNYYVIYFNINPLFGSVNSLLLFSGGSYSQVSLYFLLYALLNSRGVIIDKEY